MSAGPSVTATSPPPLARANYVASRQPSVYVKPASNSLAVALPQAGSPVTPSLISKEWVVPPRPKPGRKPATDTPPTKRKAQNRAAQRAFRERRAARVGELEEQIRQIEQEDEDEQDLLRADIERLGYEVEKYRAELELWIERYRGLERELVDERTNRKASMTAGQSSSLDVVPLPQRSPRTTSQHPEEAPEDTTVPMGCGNCTTATRCQCIDEAFNIHNITSDTVGSSSNPKRPHSPSHPNSGKRIKVEHPESLETDFTSAFAAQPRPPASRPEVVSPSAAVADLCGFCSVGTSCICAEMAVADQSTKEIQSPSRLPGISQLSHITPPPSEGDVSSSLQSHLLAGQPCASGPGTCAQCRADPNSTVFCKSLAAAASRSQPTSSSANPRFGCSSGTTSNAGCCIAQPQPQPRPRPPHRLQSTSIRSAARSPTTTPANTHSDNTNDRSDTGIPSITLTCADAYTTLSRHPAYERASEEIGTWMPRLQASTSSARVEGRAAMEIDAANVMSVLREFDRRFGENC